MAYPSADNKSEGYGHSYDNVRVGGSAQVHMGDIHYHSPKIDKTKEIFARCLRDLLLTDTRDDLAAVSNEKGSILNGSCEWVLSQKAYSKWLDSDGFQALKITGPAGIGKTTIIRFIQNGLSIKSGQDSKSLLLYYFFDARQEIRRTSTALLRSLILQILRGRPHLFSVIRDDYEQHAGKFITNFYTLWRNFRALILQLGNETVYVVIDALDECDLDSRRELLNELSIFPGSQVHPATGNIKLLLATRPEPDIQDELHGWSSLQVDTSKIGADLNRYIEEQVQALSDKKNYPDALKKDVAAALIDKAGGTFLWVSFVLRELSKAKNYEVRGKLETLPTGLDGVFERILIQIPEDDKQAAKFVLDWVLVSRRPITVMELATAYGIHKKLWNITQLPTSTQVSELQEVYRCCEPLLFIDPKSTSITLLHQSVRDFLLSEKLKTSPSIAKFSVDLEDAHFRAFETCWIFFSSENFASGTFIVHRKGRKLYKSERSNAGGISLDGLEWKEFLTYAEGNWAYHAAASSHKVIASTRWEGAELSKMPTMRDLWLFRSVEIGNYSLTKMLLDRGADAAATYDGQTSLHLAVSRCDFEAVELLLNNGVSVDLKDDEGRPAILLAANTERREMVDLLRRHGARMISPTSRVCDGLLSPAAQKPTANELFDADGKPITAYLKMHFFREGKLSDEQAISILDRTKILLSKEPNVLELQTPINIGGQILGQFYDMLKMFEIGGAPGESQYLFLGNNVGRGYFNFECILYLCSLKLSFPTRIHILRGKQECRHLADYFIFKTECIHKYSELVYEACLDLFNSMPLAALLRNCSGMSYLCVAGGIGPNLHSLADINEIDRFREPPVEGNMCDILWAAADELYGEEREGTPWFTHNASAGHSYCFTYSAVSNFLAVNELSCLITANYKVDAGYLQYKDTEKGIPSLITIFSAPNYLDMYGNKGALLHVEDNHFHIKQFEHSPHPYILPNFLDVWTWTLPFIAEKMSEMANVLVDAKRGNATTDNDGREETLQGDKDVENKEAVGDEIATDESYRNPSFLFEEILDLPPPARKKKMWFG